jgi:hypothetical protein
MYVTGVLQAECHLLVPLVVNRPYGISTTTNPSSWMTHSCPNIQVLESELVVIHMTFAQDLSALRPLPSLKLLRSKPPLHVQQTSRTSPPQNRVYFSLLCVVWLKFRIKATTAKLRKPKLI